MGHWAWGMGIGNWELAVLNSVSAAGPRNRGTVSDARRLEESFAIRMQEALPRRRHWALGIGHWALGIGNKLPVPLNWV
jgi:hypothetical protein